jgi:predicted aspartyl protease
MIIKVQLQIIDLHEDGYHPLVEVSIFGKPFILVLDTGASKTAFDQTILLQAGDQARIISSDRVSTGLGTSDMVSATSLISDMQIGELSVSPFEVAVLDLSTINIAYSQMNHPEVLGVLGGDVLMKYRAVISYGKQTLELEI